MNREQILKEIEETKKHLEELERLAKEDEKNWKPKKGENYYYISTELGVMLTYFADGCSSDFNRIEVGNCFRTQEEAEFEAERIKVRQELRKYAHNFTKEELEDRDLIKWCLKYVPGTDILVGDEYYSSVHSDILFKYEETCAEVIERIGKDRIKKYYFGVTE